MHMSAKSEPLDVFLTVDTEVWPFAIGWPTTALPANHGSFAREVRGYIYGDTPDGQFGLPYQIETLRRHGLSATYFVEPLFAARAGMHHLREIVDLVQSGGQEVQLHIHTEWLGELHDPCLPAGFRQHIRQFTEAEQALIIDKGIDLLGACGASDLRAFRAGNYGASFATLRALRRCGLHFDSSYNASYLGSACDMPTPRYLLQPREIDGIVEYPVSVFADPIGRLRHAQLCACSFGEMRESLLKARKAGWTSFVIVMHGFELVKQVRNPAKRRPDWVNVRRFEELCRFLAGHRDQFSTRVFSELPVDRPPTAPADALQRVSPRHTAWRMIEQAASRWL